MTLKDDATMANRSAVPPETRHGSEERPPWPRTIAAVGIMAACFSFLEMGLLPALPIIQRNLAGADTASTALLESGVLIVAAVASPLLGKLGDCRGKKNMLALTLAIYFLGSLGAALAPDFIALILFRALQGVGGALMLLGIAIARDEVPPERLNVGIGWIIGAFGAGNVFVAEAVGKKLTGIAVGFNSLMRLIAGGIGAQIAAMLIISQSMAGSQAPRELAFTVAFGVSALLGLMGVGVALFVPGDRGGCNRSHTRPGNR